LEHIHQELAKRDWLDPAQLLGQMGQEWPSVDVVETGTEVFITAPIPGLKQTRDVKLELKGNILKLEGEVSPEYQDLAVVKVHQQERRPLKFSRTITLPVAVDVRNCRASYRRGILEVKLPRVQGWQGETIQIDFFK
jgi:HSP20 family protein